MNVKEPEWVLKNRKKGIMLFSKLKNQELGYLPKDFSFDDVKLGAYEREFFSVKNDKKIFCMDIQDAFSKYGKILKKNFGKLLETKDKIFAFQNAYWNAGLFVYVPPNTIFNMPLLINPKQSSKSILSRLFFFVDKGSEITIMDETQNGNSKFYGKAVEVFVMENSKVNYVDIKNSNYDTAIDVKRCSLSNDAVLNWVTVEAGSSNCFYEVTSFLDGEGSKTKNFSAFLANKEQQISLNIKAIHNSPRTESRLLTKGAVADSSKAKFNGLIEIAEKAKNSDGYQKLEALILNEGAKVDTVPDLLINNNAVKCSHGSSVSQLDMEKVFYLMSRGITMKEAKKMIVEGFFGIVLSEIIYDPQINVIEAVSSKLED